jgi:hypothetical protein
MERMVILKIQSNRVWTRCVGCVPGLYAAPTRMLLIGMWINYIIDKRVSTTKIKTIWFLYNQYWFTFHSRRIDKMICGSL